MSLLRDWCKSQCSSATFYNTRRIADMPTAVTDAVLWNDASQTVWRLTDVVNGPIGEGTHATGRPSQNYQDQIVPWAMAVAPIAVVAMTAPSSVVRPVL